jgi:hypothetical protein
MSIILIPAGLQKSSQAWGQKRFDQTFAGGDTGASQTRVLGPPRWTSNITSAAMLGPEKAAIWRALIVSLRGRVNQLAVYNASNPLPRGTARGSIVVHTAAAAGSTAITFNGGSPNVGKSLLRGDWIGLSQDGARRQLVQIMGDDAFGADGLRAFSFEPALRWPVAAASAVVVDRPTCLMRQTTDDSSWNSTPAQLQGGFSLDLMESWE